MDGPPVDELLPTGKKPGVRDSLDRSIELAGRRPPHFAEGAADWSLEEREFFGGLRRQRIWVS